MLQVLIRVSKNSVASRYLLVSSLEVFFIAVSEALRIFNFYSDSINLLICAKADSGSIFIDADFSLDDKGKSKFLIADGGTLEYSHKTSKSVLLHFHLLHSHSWSCTSWPSYRSVGHVFLAFLLWLNSTYKFL